jgi:hypothetical protein
MANIKTRALFRRNFKATITNLDSGKSVDIEGLRIAFKLTKTKKAKGNRANIQIYNMSPTNRGLSVAPNTKEGSPQIILALFGGYGKEAKLLFNGVGTASSEWDAPDWVTKFILTDSNSLSTPPFEKAYSKGAPLDTIIDDLLNALQIPTGIVQLTGISLKHSRSFSGPPDYALEELASTYGFIFDIQDGKTNILQPGFLSLRSVITISKDTGMIRTPYWEGSIVKVRCLIIPEITPNSVVSIETTDTKVVGQYTVVKVGSTGDNWGDNAFMDLELEPRELEALYGTLPGVELLV